MRTYDQLSPDEQAKAKDAAIAVLLEDIVSGAIRFDDAKNGDDLQARIDHAAEQADRMQTPWFAGEYIYDAARDEIDGMASCDAESSYYPEPGELVLRLA